MTNNRRKFEKNAKTKNAKDQYLDVFPIVAYALH